MSDTEERSGASPRLPCTIEPLGFAPDDLDTRDATDKAAAVLDEHRAKPAGSPHCACGWRPAISLNDTESDRLQHLYHQAVQLALAGILASSGALR